jgi:Htaa protein
MSFNRLTWGVKASFRAYVEAAEGSITLSDGATASEDGAFVFSALPGGDLAIEPDGSATGAMQFQGTVTFEAHGGMLKATLTELGLEAGAEGLVLTALDTPMNTDRCTIAKLGPIEVGEGSSVTLAAEITLDGMYQIADNYPPGTALDPVRLD